MLVVSDILMTFYQHSHNSPTIHSTLKLYHFLQNISNFLPTALIDSRLPLPINVLQSVYFADNECWRLRQQFLSSTKCVPRVSYLSREKVQLATELR